MLVRGDVRERSGRDMRLASAFGYLRGRGLGRRPAYADTPPDRAATDSPTASMGSLVVADLLSR